MHLVRRFTVAVLGCVGVALMCAAWSWACTPPAYIHAADGQGSEGVAGSLVRITGAVRADDPAPAPVEFHWRDKATGAEIQFLKTIPMQKSGGEFTTTIQVPANAGTGVYVIVAFAEGKESLGAATMAYRVVAPAASPAASTTPGAPAQTETSTAGGPAPTPGAEASSGSPAAVDPAPSQPAQGPAQPSAVSTPAQQAVRGAQPVAPAPAGPGRVDQPSDAAVNGAPTAAGDAGPLRQVGTDQATDPGRQAGSGVTDGQGVAEGPDGGVGVDLPPAGVGAADPQSPRTAYDDLWSGLRRSPSLTPSALRGAGAPEATSPLTMAAGVFSVGLLLVSAGFGIAEVQRRRALAQA